MTQLVREALRSVLAGTTDAHAGLLLQRGWTDYVQTTSQNDGAGGKSNHLKRICKIPANDLYKRAYLRWLTLTGDDKRFSRSFMRVKGRLLVGLGGGGALETGCAVSHTHGVPYLPGSSIKGVARAWAEEIMPEWQIQFNDLFGCEDHSGMITFHDAWWVPDSGSAGRTNHPFVMDIVTTHHPEYYAGKSPATDLDSPVPNGMLGVRGSFLFVLEGDSAWRDLAAKILKNAVEQRGVGAKTNSGFGFLAFDENETQKLQKEVSEQQFVPATIKLTPGNGEIRATLLNGNHTTAPLKGQVAHALLNKLPEDVRKGKKIKEGKLKVEVQVKSTGNLIELVDIRPIP